jgi:hypothetical protein
MGGLALSGVGLELANLPGPLASRSTRLAVGDVGRRRSRASGHLKYETSIAYVVNTISPDN